MKMLYHISLSSQLGYIEANLASLGPFMGHLAKSMAAALNASIRARVAAERVE